MSERFTQAGKDEGVPTKRWERTTIRSLAGIHTVAAMIDRALAEAGFPGRDRFGVRMAVEEAIANAIKHGHGGNEDRPVKVRYRVSPTEVLVQVEDQGPGFDLLRVADPLEAENLERPTGRGLLLIRAYTTWVRHHGRGNRVTFCRTRSAS